MSSRLKQSIKVLARPFLGPLDKRVRHIDDRVATVEDRLDARLTAIEQQLAEIKRLLAAYAENSELARADVETAAELLASVRRESHASGRV